MSKKLEDEAKEAFRRKHKLILEVINDITASCDKSFRYEIINETPDAIGYGAVSSLIDKILGE